MTSNALIEFRRPTQPLLDEARPLVARDNATIIRATDMVVKGGKVIGYLSIADVPTVLMWFDREHTTPHDYLTCASYWEGVMNRSGIVDYFLPCESTSELINFIPRLGHVKTNYDHVFIKRMIPQQDIDAIRK